jgi:hypothetical protein
MGIEPILSSLSKADKLARSRADIRRILELVIEDARLSAIRSAERVGIVEEAQPLVRSAEDAAADARQIDAVEQQLKGQRPGTLTTLALAGASNPRRVSSLRDLVALFPTHKRVELGALAIRLALSAGAKGAADAGLLYQMQGAIREVVALFLEDVVAEVRTVVVDVRHTAARARSETLTVIDTAVHGPVELPARVQGGDSALKLGSDRLVGPGRIEPQEVLIDPLDPTKGVISISGVLNIALAIEVKGRTTATGGIRQLQSLLARGDRGYAQIGGQLWLLEYDFQKVTHLVVAPPGDELVQATAQAATLTKNGFRTKVVPIPLAIDNQIFPLARGYLQAALEAITR